MVLFSQDSRKGEIYDKNVLDALIRVDCNVGSFKRLRGGDANTLSKEDYNLVQPSLKRKILFSLFD